MCEAKRDSTVPLPKGWHGWLKPAVLQIISLAQHAVTHARGWAADSVNARVRLQADNQGLEAEVALLREEIRIKDARMEHIAPHRRPQYSPVERMAILELRSARCWSLEQTARAFLVTAATIASWVKRVNEGVLSASMHEVVGASGVD